MPTGTPYNSMIWPYRIRVDSFGSTSNISPEDSPQLHLLTHTHSDHIDGLSAKSFGHQVVCSHDAKEMLLKHEVYSERHLQALDLRAETIRTYRHLRVDPITNMDGNQYYSGSRDLLVCLEGPTMNVHLNSSNHLASFAPQCSYCIRTRCTRKGHYNSLRCESLSRGGDVQ